MQVKEQFPSPLCMLQNPILGLKYTVLINFSSMVIANDLQIIAEGYRILHHVPV